MKYSIYVFLDQYNRPYYVGKTNSMPRRRKEHLYEILTKNMLPKYKKARQLYIGKKHPFTMKAIRTTTSEKEAYRLERLYIKKYRKAGYQLMNCTYGGPDELPMRINKPKKQNTKGLVFKKKKKNIIKKSKVKTLKKKAKSIKKRRRS